MTLTELEELEKKATAGPWKWEGAFEEILGPYEYSYDKKVMIAATNRKYNYGVNGPFITAARNMLPKLIAVAKAAADLKEYSRECIGFEVEYSKAEDWLIKCLNDLEKE